MAVTNLAMIAACDPKGVIGKGGQLPWKTLEGDLKRFKALTLGKVLIMGRRTIDSLPGPLNDRTILRVSRRRVNAVDGPLNEVYPPRYTISLQSVGVAISTAMTLRTQAHEEVLIAGGGEIYRWSWEHASRIYLTVSKAEYDGDVVVTEFADLISGKDINWTLKHTEEFSDNFYFIYDRKRDVLLD